MSFYIEQIVESLKTLFSVIPALVRLWRARRGHGLEDFDEPILLGATRMDLILKM